jgi:membrane fusion protein (multidrug efflux system)
VPELEVGLLRPGCSAAVTIDSQPGRKFNGSVREVIPVADATSKNYRVRVSVLGGGDRLPANGFARATVDVGTRRDAVALTRDAINAEGGDKYVWLIQDDGKGGATVKRQVVEPGVVEGTFIQILSGLKPGDQVVASGSPAIVDGTPVQVKGFWKSLPTPNGPPGSVPFGDTTPPKEEGGRSGHGHGHKGQGGAPVTGTSPKSPAP